MIAVLGAEEKPPQGGYAPLGVQDLDLFRAAREASRGGISFVFLAAAPKSEGHSLGDGLTWRGIAATIPAHRSRDAASFEIASALASVNLIHFRRLDQRLAEGALLEACLAHRPIVVQEHAPDPRSLAAQIGLAQLADTRILRSRFAAAEHRTSRGVHVVPMFLQERSPAAASGSLLRRRGFLWTGTQAEGKQLVRISRMCPETDPLMMVHTDAATSAAAAAVTPGTSSPGVCSPGIDGRSGGQRFGWFRKMGQAVHASAESRDDFGSQVNSTLALIVTQRGFHPAHPSTLVNRILTAMREGLPIVALRGGPFAEYVRHGEGGFLYDDERDLQDKLKYLLGPPERAAQLGAGAQRHFSEEFSREVAGSTLWKVYESLLAPERALVSLGAAA